MSQVDLSLSIRQEVQESQGLGPHSCVRYRPTMPYERSSVQNTSVTSIVFLQCCSSCLLRFLHGFFGCPKCQSKDDVTKHLQRHAVKSPALPGTPFLGFSRLARPGSLPLQNRRRLRSYSAGSERFTYVIEGAIRTGVAKKEEAESVAKGGYFYAPSQCDNWITSEDGALLVIFEKK